MGTGIMTALIENIRKLMGWCSSVTKMGYILNRQVDFENPLLIPFGRSNVEKFKSNNVLFSADISVFTFCIVVSLNLALMFGRNLDYAVLIPILMLMYSLLYFLVVKMLQASISIDENGVYLKSFELRDVLLNYNDIKFSPYYSVITDQLTASGIQAVIENHRGGE
jgi:hypothetical protein